jgi:hypothetical protein
LAEATSELNLLGEPGEGEEVSDLLAIAADWAAIGEDFWTALGGEAHRVEREDPALLALLAVLIEEIEGDSG